MIKVRELTKVFRNNSKDEIILKNIDMDVKKGELVTIMGPSGGGKSTFLYILSLLLKPSSGEIYYDGERVEYDILDKYKRDNIGLVFQDSNLISSLNPVENLVIAMNDNAAKKEKVERAEDLLNKIGLQEKRNSKISCLSGGEIQRIAIVRALVNNPKIVFCDEPTGSLDSAVSKNVIDILLKFKEKNDATLIIVTHDLNVGRLGDRKFYLEDGELNELY